MAGHKNKPHKGLKKRVKVTRNGKVVRGTSGNRHLATTKNAKRRRRLRTKSLLDNPAMGVTIAKSLKVYHPSRRRGKAAADAAAAEAAKTAPAALAAEAKAKPAPAPKAK